jgi:hypothetical protein
VEKELTGRETEPHEIIYFKIYNSQIPVIEQALETAALMLGTDKSGVSRLLCKRPSFVFGDGVQGKGAVPLPLPISVEVGCEFIA